MVQTVLVDEAKPGDVDLTDAHIWRADHKGFSYVISCDDRWPDAGYTATCQSRDKGSMRQTLADGVKTFSEAERACTQHARGRRNA